MMATVFKCYRHNPDDPHSLSDNSIRGQLEDHTGILWIGTWSKGLNQFDRSTERFIHYTVKNGLPSNSVWGILEEDASLDGEGGNLWLSTLFISPQTVKKHLNNIYGKLSVSGRRQAVEKAQMLGILPRR